MSSEPSYRALKCGFFHLAVAGDQRCLCGYYEAAEHVQNAVDHGVAAWITREHYASKIAKYGDYYAYRAAHRAEIAAKQERERQALDDARRAAREVQNRVIESLWCEGESHFYVAMEGRCRCGLLDTNRKVEPQPRLAKWRDAVVPAECVSSRSSLFGGSLPRGLEKLFRESPPSRWKLTPGFQNKTFSYGN